MGAYYSENDPVAAQWLRNLINAGHIADGEVDERSITEVEPADLRGFTQCHFFAGIGIWSHSLRQAGWPDDRPVWTGSCPCQPFSAAGKGDEFDDERHLWPAWFRLIRECRPVVVLGEQVASKDALTWFDHVSTDLEGEAYTVGAVDSCAASYGAPHIRQRLYFVADANGRHASTERQQRSGEQRQQPEDGGAGWMADADVSAGQRSEPQSSQRPVPQGNGEMPASELGNTPSRGRRERGDAPQQGSSGHADGAEQSDIVGDAIDPGLERYSGHGAGLVRHEREISQPNRPVSETGDAPSDTNRTLADSEHDGGRPGEQGRETQGRETDGRPGPCNGFWSDAEWLPCIDGKARPVEPGTFPLAHGIAGRVGRLRAYGNGLTAPQATEFVTAFIETTQEIIE